MFKEIYWCFDFDPIWGKFVINRKTNREIAEFCRLRIRAMIHIITLQLFPASKTQVLSQSFSLNLQHFSLCKFTRGLFIALGSQWVNFLSEVASSKLFLTKKNSTNSPIYQFTNFKCCVKARKPFKSPCLRCIISYLLLWKTS